LATASALVPDLAFATDLDGFTDIIVFCAVFYKCSFTPANNAKNPSLVSKELQEAQV
jgi:hypothetical protein